MASDIFPDDTAEEIMARVSEVWDFDQPFPWPKVDLSCQVCGSGALHPRFWRFFNRGERSRIPWRCDVGVKCTRCSVVLTFGVPVPEDVFRNTAERLDIVNQQKWWRDVRHLFEPEVAPVSSWEEIDADD